MSRRSRLPGYVSRAIVSGGGGGDPPPGGERDWGYIPSSTSVSVTPQQDLWSLIPPSWFTVITAYVSDKIASLRTGRLTYVGNAPKVFLVLATFRLYDSTGNSTTKIAVRQGGRTSKELQGVSGSDPVFGGSTACPLIVYEHTGAHHSIVQLSKNEFVDCVVAATIDNDPPKVGLQAFGLVMVELRGSYGVLQDLADGSDTATAWVKLPGTTAAYLLKDFTQGADTRLTYGGSVTRRFRVDLLASSTVGNYVALGVYKDGTLVTGSDMPYNTSSGPYSKRTHCFVELAQNSYVEGWWYATSGGKYRYGLIMSAVELGEDYGRLYLTALGSIPFSTGILTCTTALDSVVNNFSMPSNNRLQYGGAVTKRFLISADVATYDSTASYHTYHVQLYKNGSPITPSTDVIAASSQRRASLHTQAMVELAPGDYVEVWGSSGGSGSQALGYVLSASEFA